MYDLHGIAELVNEDEPGFVVAKRLAQLQESLNRKLPNKEAYEMALKIDSDYVCKPNFSLEVFDNRYL